MTDKIELPPMDLGDDEDNLDMAALEKKALLDQMKAQANLLGVPYAPNIGLETLSERVRAFKEAHAGEEKTELAAPITSEVLTAGGVKVPTDIEAQYEIFHAKQLIRVSIVCVNPARTDLPADLYTIFSSSLGRISQVIPYQAPNGYHIPRCLANLLREKTYTAFRPSNIKKGENGCDREHFEMPEFIITELPPLTAEEFDRIVKRQDRQQAVNLEDD